MGVPKVKQVFSISPSSVSRRSRWFALATAKTPVFSASLYFCLRHSMPSLAIFHMLEDWRSPDTVERINILLRNTCLADFETTYSTGSRLHLTTTTGFSTCILVIKYTKASRLVREERSTTTFTQQPWRPNRPRMESHPNHLSNAKRCSQEKQA